MTLHRLGLRARLVAAFVGVAALSILVAALLTARGVEQSFDDYLGERSNAAVAGGVDLARATFAEDGGWTLEGLDRLSHELVLTGYDFRLRQGSRVLLDTTQLTGGRALARVAVRSVSDPSGGEVARLEVYAYTGGGATPADSRLKGQLDRLHLMAAALAALVAIVCGLVVAQRLTGPLRRLAGGARGLATGEPAPAVPARASPEVRQLGEALEGLAEDLAAQQRYRRRLAQDLAHELRTPLMLMQMRIEGMQDGLLAFDAGGLESLHTEVQRLARLIGQIERLAEAESWSTSLVRQPVSLDEAARELHAALAGAFELREIEVTLEDAPALALGDADAVRQIGANLLSNALKYAPERGRVVLATGVEDGQALLQVIDSGSAIEGPSAERIFDRVSRGHEDGTGAGLGLTIARELAVAQGGSLELDRSALGTRFVLRLPRASATKPQAVEPAPSG